MEVASEGQPADRRTGGRLARKAIEENELQRSRHAPYERVLGWLLPRIGR
jgi:hypothetical protein